MCIYSVHSEFPNMAPEIRNMYTEIVHPELSPVVKKKITTLMFSKISYLHQPLIIGYSRSPFARTDQSDWHTGYLFLAKFVAG